VLADVGETGPTATRRVYSRLKITRVNCDSSMQLCDFVSVGHGIRFGLTISVNIFASRSRKNYRETLT